jgi:hypothetical protein
VVRDEELKAVPEDPVSKSWLVAAEKPWIKDTKPSLKGVISSLVESSVLYGRLWREDFLCNMCTV